MNGYITSPDQKYLLKVNENSKKIDEWKFIFSLSNVETSFSLNKLAKPDIQTAVAHLKILVSKSDGDDNKKLWYVLAWIKNRIGDKSIIGPSILKDVYTWVD